MANVVKIKSFGDKLKFFYSDDNYFYIPKQYFKSATEDGTNIIFVYRKNTGGEKTLTIPFATLEQTDSNIEKTAKVFNDFINDLEEAKNFDLDVSRGRQPNTEFGDKFGSNSSIAGNTNPEDLWNGGGIYTGFPDVSETLEIFSSSPNDTAGGTGARTVTISNLLDDDFNLLDPVTVTMNGTTPVSLGAQTYRRCSRARVITAGSNLNNEGQITIRHTTTTSNIFAVMPANQGTTEIVALTVPNGFEYHVVERTIAMSRSGGQSGSARVCTRVRENADIANSAWQNRNRTTITTVSSFSKVERIPVVYREKTDIVIRKLDASNTCQIFASIEFYIVNTLV